MNLKNALQIVARRWWIILLVTAVAVGGAAGYSLSQTARYQATATVLVHPSSDANSPSVFSDELNLLSYGSLTQTFASLAQSPSMIRGAATHIGLQADAANAYTATGALIPQTTVLEVSVSGPDPATVVRLANQLVTDVSTETKSYFHIIDLTALDPATAPAVKTRPKTTKNMELGGIAGVVLGIAIAALAGASRRREGEDRSSPVELASAAAQWLGEQIPTDEELATTAPSTPRRARRRARQ